MKTISSFFKKSFFPFLLFTVVLIISYQNYEPGTWLSGWDSLHPEFNFGLYFKRTLFGVWQTHQGLGAVASQAHIAELPRLLFLFAISLFTPLSMVRYLFFFTTLVLGPLGLYCFAKYILEKAGKKHASKGAFLAALFYLFNLVTLQQFYVPFEMFALHFASLPWIFYFATLFLKQGRRKHLLAFAGLSFFSAAIAHTATLFYVFYFSFSLFIISLFLLKRRWKVLKRGVVLLGATLCLNAFWLLPNLYYVKNHAKEVSTSKIHRIFSDEAFLQSEAFGDKENLGLLKNFLFNWREYDFKEGKFVDLLNEWEAHLTAPAVKEVGYALFAMALMGILIALFSREKYALSFILPFILALVFWINANPPLTFLFEKLREIDLLREALRFPFTKFSILLTFFLSIYFGLFSQFFLRVFSKIKLSFFVFLGIASLIFYFNLPALTGSLISPSMRVVFPGNYFKIFDYFEGTKGRVAKLPLNTFWGWNFYDWGYQGAGFTWFGIENPTLDREFDRWSKYNENFYNEASFALYGEDIALFEKVLEKYQVKYLLLDESIINAGGAPEPLFIDEIKALARESTKIKEAKKIGFLTVYETPWGEREVFPLNNLAQVDAKADYGRRDNIISSLGDYVASPEGITFPFASFDARAGIKTSFGDGKVTVKSPNLTFPGVKELLEPPERPEGVSLSINKEKKLEVTFPVQEFTKNDLKSEGVSEAFNCDLEKEGEVEKKIAGEEIIYSATGNGVSCDFFIYPEMAYDKGYVVRVKGENRKGRSLKIYLFNQATGRPELEELLPTGAFDEYFFVLPKKGKEGGGFTLNLETRSFGRVAAENVVERIEVAEFPYEWISGLTLRGGGGVKLTGDLVVESSKTLGNMYEVETTGTGMLVLNQAFEKNWRAYKVEGGEWYKKALPFIFGKELPHSEVNSWANGFYIVEGGTVIILFLPQYLEWVGIAILLITFLSLLKRKKRQSFVQVAEKRIRKVLPK